MVDAGQAAQNDIASDRPKRVRTGCLKCRIRRRKCDEGKPRCQSCVDRNFECQYGSQLTFLGKNAFTIPPSDLLASASSVQYTTLRFVAEGPAKKGQEGRVQEQPTTTTGTGDDTRYDEGLEEATHLQSDPQQDVMGSSQVVLALDFGTNYDEDTNGTISAQEPSREHQQQRQQQQQQQQQQQEVQPDGELDQPGTAHSHDYESALRGLLALGTASGPNGTIPIEASSSTKMPVLSHTPAHASVSRPREGVDVAEEFEQHHQRETGNGIPDDSPGVSSHSTDSNISQERILQLMRHFRYEVAPWLDICDMAQSFGIYVPRVAVESEPVRYALLALSAVTVQIDSLSTSGARLQEEASYLLSLSQSHQNDTCMDDETKLLLGALLKARHYISDIPKACQNLIVDDDMDILDEVSLQTPGSGLTPSIYWLLLRLELSGALIGETAIRIPLLVPSNYVHARNSTDLAGSIFQSAHQPLLLCAKAINFGFGEDDSCISTNAAPRGSPIESWKILVEELNIWYNNRPQEFQPMVELDAPEQAFSVILFTNGAGLFANQLYHTAMLLLLQNKPRTLRLMHRHSSTISPLWHAERICSIALNNDRSECWDLSLLASLLFAAKRMTHESQQRAILRGFERIRAITGWDFGDCLGTLREEWNHVTAV